MAAERAKLTFGLLSPNKGIEYALRALPDIIREYPNIVYIVLGQTHPNLLRDEGEAYRLSLQRLAKDLGVQKHVVFFNRFVELAPWTAPRRRTGRRFGTFPAGLLRCALKWRPSSPILPACSRSRLPRPATPTAPRRSSMWTTKRGRRIYSVAREE